MGLQRSIAFRIRNTMREVTGWYGISEISETHTHSDRREHPNIHPTYQHKRKRSKWKASSLANDSKTEN